MAAPFAPHGSRCHLLPVADQLRFSWLVRNRRLRIDYERRVQTSETLIEVAIIRLLLRRLAAVV